MTHKVALLGLIAIMIACDLISPNGTNAQACNEAAKRRVERRVKLRPPCKVSRSRDDLVVKKVVRNVEVSAYSSDEGQTDSSPCVTARESWVYDGVLAANWLPNCQPVLIPELFGDKVIVKEDAMNERYGHGHVDVWRETREQARQIGRRKGVTIYLLKER